MSAGSSPTAPVRQRLENLDVLRAFALIAVLVGHVWYTGLPNRLIYSWHVPLFFLLSGLLWTRGRTVRAELRRRWPVLVTPYIAWWVVNFVVGCVYIVGRGDTITPAWVLYSIWGGSSALRPFTAFWFFSAFLFALLTLRLLERYPRWVSYAVAIVAIALCLIEPSHHLSPGWIMRRLPLDLGTGVASTLFLLVGQDLRRFTDRKDAAWWGLGGLVVGFGLVLVPGYKALEMKHSIYGTPGLSVAAACLIACGFVLVSRVVTDR
ncbi:MAG TPA: acyltransferase, partial [Marmoricola sp.]